MLGMVPGAGTQQETEPTLPCLVRPLLQLRGDRLETDGWFTRWSDGQARQIDLGWGRRGVEAWVGLSHCDLAEWGYLPHNGGLVG